MWNDIETKIDLLNFSVVAETAAQLVRDSGSEPLSIGISGNWGAGKSSLVKMIGSCLQDGEGCENYIFIEFNAWLYQGYDDARLALLQSVADKLIEESELRKSGTEKAVDFAKRVNWMRLGKIAGSAIAGATLGAVVGGPVGAFVGAIGGVLKQGFEPTTSDLEKIAAAYKEMEPELKDLIVSKKETSPPKEIEALRKSFHEVLKEMNVKLVVLVDDLDRCLPETTISTLEAMRLLLFLPHTAFIIAADEEMIRYAVRHHFGSSTLGDNLVTSYFDKLIQIPMRVPRLGVNEVKVYLILLFAELKMKRGVISHETRMKAQRELLDAVTKSWSHALSREMIVQAFGTDSGKIMAEIELADQLATIMATADGIAGNPRLIKRFLNNLVIRQSIAETKGMALSFAELVKMQLFERCASSAAFEYLANEIAKSEDGKPEFIRIMEADASVGKEIQAPDSSWDIPFAKEWVKLSPALADIDLRPLIYLSRDKTIALAAYDELSSKGQSILDALHTAKRIEPILITQLQEVGHAESNRLLTRICRRSRSEQFDLKSLTQAFHIPKAFPLLAERFVALLDEIPAKARPAAILPLIRNEPWAVEILKRWATDSKSPNSVKGALNPKPKS